ncbi:hypothetical protein RDI58_009181 [Solanum bulbocastanum]|uniref:Tr-type G domain-containing protein n=1 Tax=Solanum bulbocastanum TaxID=147425 RepID=A0AAN8U430_SOLBU
MDNVEEDIKVLQLDSSEDSVMTNAEDGKPGLKKEANANVHPTHVAVDRKRHLNVVFIGHVDAGKSTAGG